MARGPRVGGLPRRQTQAVQPVVEWSKRQMVNAQRSNAPNRKAQAVEPGGHVGHEDQDRHRQPHLADVLGQRGQLQLPGGGGRRGERRAAVTWSRAPLGRNPPPHPSRRPGRPQTSGTGHSKNPRSRILRRLGLGGSRGSIRWQGHCAVDSGRARAAGGLAIAPTPGTACARGPARRRRPTCSGVLGRSTSSSARIFPHSEARPTAVTR